MPAILVNNIKVVIVESKERTCCVLGHRKIDITDELINRLETIVEKLITECKVDTFLSGNFDKCRSCSVCEAQLRDD